MGQTAENVATLCGITREEQDEFAVRSQQRAERAIAAGFFADEITPVRLPDGELIAVDDGPRPGTTYEKVSALKPVFRENGTVTAGNCCSLNDGAAAIVVVSDANAEAPGHPFGMTGARITTSLLNGLRSRGGRFGLETMCVGGGQGMAMILELIR